MKLGIDFNQFNHFQLKRFFSDLGYEKIIDQFGVVERSSLIKQGLWKIAVLKLVHYLKPLRWLGLLFAGGTLFICIKKGEESKSERVRGA